MYSSRAYIYDGILSGFSNYIAHSHYNRYIADVSFTKAELTDIINHRSSSQLLNS